MVNSTAKKVSVIIPAYNKAELTVETVESVLAQTYGDIEIIVVDDGSTDDTRLGLEPYAGRIRFIHKENGGASSARNVGIREVTGEYIAFLDCDDIYLPEKIEKSVRYFEKYPKAAFVHTPVLFIDDSGEVLRGYPRYPRRFYEYFCVGRFSRRLFLKNLVCNSTVVVRASCLEEAGFFDESIFNPADWDMWLRLSEKFREGYINEPLTLYRRVKGGYTSAHLCKSEKDSLHVVEKAFNRHPELYSRLKHRAVSNVFYRHALGYLRIRDMDKTREDLAEAIRKDPFNLKVLMLAGLLKVSGRGLTAILNRRKVF